MKEILAEVEKGAFFWIGPVDSLNPQCGYQATLESARYQTRASGVTAVETVENMLIALDRRKEYA